MREGLLRSAKLALIVLMAVYLPLLVVVTWFANFMRETGKALDIEVLLASAERKVRAGRKGSKR